MTSEEPAVLRLVARRATGASVEHKASTLGATAEYYARIEVYAQKIREAEHVDDIIALLQEALIETRALHSIGELTNARRQVRLAEERIGQLKSELELVSQLVREDPLTGALNRRGLEELLARESARAARNSAPLCLALVDLDDFKQVNDGWGHAVGDSVLRHFVGVLRAAVRSHDELGRYGGEEFVLVFPDTTSDAAMALLERLRGELAQRPLLVANCPLRPTFSAGLAALATGEEPRAVLARADQALYEAKRRGKDRAVLAP